MPNYNVGATPTQVYNAPTTTTFTAPATVQLFNPGPSPVWVGNGAVNVNNGLQLNPGAHFRVVNMFTSLYACGGAVATATHTALTAALSAGGTVLTVTSGATNFPPGTAIVVGNNVSSQETLIVAGTATTSITVSTAAQYDHASSVTVATAVVTGGQVTVIPGVV